MQLLQALRFPPALSPLLHALLLALLLLPPARLLPLYHPADHTAVAAAMSDHLLASWPAREPSQQLRLPPNIDTIKKIAQILIMLGDQVVPGASSGVTTAVPLPNDPVDNI